MKEAISNLKHKLDGRIRLFVKKHTSFKNTFAGLEIGNVLVAISTTLLMALGSLPLSLPVLFSLAVFLIVLGIVGKYIDEVGDDNERLKLYEEHLKELLHRGVAYEDSSGSNTHTTGNDSIQLPNSEVEERTARSNDD